MTDFLAEACVGLSFLAAVSTAFWLCFFGRNTEIGKNTPIVLHVQRKYLVVAVLSLILPASISIGVFSEGVEPETRAGLGLLAAVFTGLSMTLAMFAVRTEVIASPDGVTVRSIFARDVQIRWDEVRQVWFQSLSKSFVLVTPTKRAHVYSHLNPLDMFLDEMVKRLPLEMVFTSHKRWTRSACATAMGVDTLAQPNVLMSYQNARHTTLERRLLGRERRLAQREATAASGTETEISYGSMRWQFLRSRLEATHPPGWLERLYNVCAMATASLVRAKRTKDPLFPGLRYSPTVFLLSLFVTGVGAVLVIATALQGVGGFFPFLYGLIGASTVVAGLLALVTTLTTELQFDDEGLHLVSLWREPRPVHWAEIASVRYHRWFHCLELRGVQPTMSVSILLEDLEEFLCALGERLPAEATLPAFERMLEHYEENNSGSPTLHRLRLLLEGLRAEGDRQDRQ